MQHSTKQKALLAFVVASLIFYVCTFLLTTNTVTNVSAVDSYGVGVYWNQTCRETEKVKNITWGDLSPGSLKNIPVYIRNEEKEPMFLRKNTTNWDPVNASKYMTLLWDYSGRRMNPGEVLQITLTLSVSPDVEGISSFRFDIRIHAYACDVNGDGRVSVADMVEVDVALGSQDGDPNWNPDADVDGDGRVSVADMAQVEISLES